ncbi:hypothetical protein [Nocardioides massiliensis]|uniref:Membrane protein n=1 Tax=Nocardioides massiliensis TaxID=1325935 RepID=A0ABT9NMC4_9ACTN|nr:hypothetical protein [Nocardioides massiliensis]MDP9821571.1 putative membrane protein [Nocardioides massiliensis]
MSHTTGDPSSTADEDARISGGAIALAVALAVGYLVLVGLGMWFLPDLTAWLAPAIGDGPTAQRLAGWAVWAAFLLPTALVFLRAARHQSRGTRTSTAGRWVTAGVLALLAVPGFVTFGGRGAPDGQTQSALEIIGPDFALGVLLGRLGAVAVVFVFIGLVIARRGAIADRERGTTAFLRTPAYAALAVLAITLVLAFLLEPA